MLDSIQELQRSYEIPSTAIIHELLDNEIIIANLRVGTYYSVRESGIPIWQLLVAGHRLDAIAKLLDQKYHGDFSSPICSFLDQLLAENLLTPSQNRCPTSFEPLWPQEYATPVFSKYEEMKNLLMIDPIHEVDEKGWPSRFNQD